MSLPLRSYPEYSDSGLPWLGKIPAKWRVLRAKFVFDCVDVRSKAGDEELLTVSSGDGVVPRSQKTVTMFQAESYAGHKLCWPGDLVINSLWAWMGGLGFTQYHGIVSSAYGVYRPSAGFSAMWPYFDYLLRSGAYDWELQVRSKGIWTSRLQLTDESFLDMPIVVPLQAEAETIAKFLYTHDRRIRRFIAAKRRLIALLNEQKQAIISRAVTHGLDPNVRLKPSGIDWLGEVPEHWDVVPLIRCASELSDYRGATPEKVDRGLFLVTARNIRMGWIDYEASQEYVRPEQYNLIMRRGLPKCGDILLTTEAPLGHVALIDREDVALAQRIIRFRMDERKMIPNFTLYSLMAHYFQWQLEVRATGSTALGIKASKLAQLLVVCPPLQEQAEVAAQLDDRTQRLDNAVRSTEREIRLLREYRARLIADVVTGRLDVRGVELPPLEEAKEIVPVRDEIAEGLSDQVQGLQPVEETINASD